MNFNRPKVTRRRRRKSATTHLYDFITLFSFCKVRLRSFFALFLRFLPPFPPPGNDVGGRTQNRDGRRTRRGQAFAFFGFRGQERATVFSRERPSPVPSLQTQPPVARIFPSTPVARPLFVGATTRLPHVLPARLPRQTTCKRGRRRGVSLETGFIRRPDSIGRSGSAFHDASPRRESRFSCVPRYSAARTMRSGYTLLVRSVDPSGQIMSRTYPSSPNVTGISTVRVS